MLTASPELARRVEWKEEPPIGQVGNLELHRSQRKGWNRLAQKESRFQSHAANRERRWSCPELLALRVPGRQALHSEGHFRHPKIAAIL